MRSLLPPPVGGVSAAETGALTALISPRQHRRVFTQAIKQIKLHQQTRGQPTKQQGGVMVAAATDRF